MSFRERDVCGDKVKFASKKQARSSLNAMRKRDTMHAYLCPFCFHWHVGHGKREAPRAVKPRGQ